MGTPRIRLPEKYNTSPKKEDIVLPDVRKYAAMFLRGVSGFAPGGLIGAGAGLVGEGLAQTIEDREDYNFPQMGTQAALGAIPFGKVVGIGKGMLKGGLMGGAGTLATQQTEEGLHIPTSEELPQIALGTGLGAIGGGFASKIKLPKKYTDNVSKVANESKEVLGPLAKPIIKPTSLEGVKTEPNQPNIKLDLRTRPKNPIIMSTDKEAGRKIMNQILEESARTKASQTPTVSLQNVTSKEPKGSKIVSAINITKSLASSGDLSFPLRQGIFVVGRKAWWNAWKPMIQALREGKYNEINETIFSNPRAKEAIDNGLDVTSLEGLLKREEAFYSSLAEKIPIVGKYLIKPSERAYITFANKLRMDLYNDLANKAEKLGNPVDKKMLAAYINSATGRGSMGLRVGESSKTLEGAAPFLNTILFSPKLMFSRTQLLNPMSYVKMDPFTRKEALRDLATITSMAGTVLGLAKLNGAEVDFDPTSPEFAKIKIGNTRIDPLGGFSQYVRFFSQAVKGLGTDEPGPDPRRFIESKLSPSAQFVLENIRKKDYFGRDVKIPDSVLKAFTPLLARDIYELWKEDPNLVPLSGLSALGVGVQTYGEADKKGTPSGIPRIRIKLPKGYKK